MFYSDNFAVQDQLNIEEKVAALIFDFEYATPEERPSEDVCQELSQQIVNIVLQKFRPDLFKGRHENKAKEKEPGYEQ